LVGVSFTSFFVAFYPAVTALGPVFETLRFPRDVAESGSFKDV